MQLLMTEATSFFCSRVATSAINMLYTNPTLYLSITKLLFILTCCYHLSGTVSAHTSVPGWCDGDVVLRPALQGAEVTTTVCASAVVSMPHGVNCWHRVYDPWHTVVPGYSYNADGAVDSGKEGCKRTGGWEEEWKKWKVEVTILDEEQHENISHTINWLNMFFKNRKRKILNMSVLFHMCAICVRTLLCMFRQHCSLCTHSRSIQGEKRSVFVFVYVFTNVF